MNWYDDPAYKRCVSQAWPAKQRINWLSVAIWTLFLAGGVAGCFITAVAVGG